jgi:hypothetical protein
MDEILASAEITPNSSLHVATLSRQNLFEVNELPAGITVLGKAVSFEAAIRLADLLFPQIALAQD